MAVKAGKCSDQSTRSVLDTAPITSSPVGTTKTAKHSAVVNGMAFAFTHSNHRFIYGPLTDGTDWPGVDQRQTVLRPAQYPTRSDGAQRKTIFLVAPSLPSVGEKQLLAINFVAGHHQLTRWR